MNQRNSTDPTRGSFSDPSSGKPIHHARDILIAGWGGLAESLLGRMSARLFRIAYRNEVSIMVLALLAFNEKFQVILVFRWQVHIEWLSLGCRTQILSKLARVLREGVCFFKW